MIWVLFLVFIVSMAVGLPIAMSLGISSLAYLLFSDIPLVIIPQRMYGGMDVFILLSIPGFILAGNLMNRGGITKKIVGFANALVGHIRGGLGLANIIGSMIFAGISGTAVADSASLGAVLIPAMKDEGYEADFACAVTAASSTIGPIIPPSLPMIVAGTLTGLSVGRLFVAGAIPGLLLGIGLMAVSYYISVKRRHPKGRRAPFREIVKNFGTAFWALLMTCIILFGIIGGVFTPTEASMVAAVYALIIGLFVYKGLKFRDLPQILLESSITTASIIVLVGFANLFAWILVSEGVPQTVAGGLLSISENRFIILLLINILLLFVGTFMETISALLILFPVLLRVATDLGIDEIHFAMIVVLNLMIGLTTPPMGVCLFVTSSIGRVSLFRISKAILPFLAISIVVLALVTYVPQISLFLPNLVFNR